MPNLVTDGMRFQTTPDDLAINALISRMYGGGNIRGPYFYPRSPYALNGLGDLVPGQMPTQFGTMRVIPEAAQMLATSPPSTSSQDWDVPQSVGQDTGRYDMAQPAFASLNDLKPIVLSASPETPLTPISPMTLAGPMPSVLHPRPDAAVQQQASDTGFACWVSEHPVLSVGAAVLLFMGLRGGKQ